MPDLRKPYAFGKSLTGWGIAQGKTVSPTTDLQWGQFKVHLTIDSWDTTGSGGTAVRRVKTFHFSFKSWQGQSLEGANQPGCSWEWSSTLSKFEFKGWWKVDYLYLTVATRLVVAGKVNAFVRRYVEYLLMDAQLWAALGDATTPT